MITRAKDVLITARAKIKKGWCQHSFAESKQGDVVSADSPKAVKWCLIGSLQTVEATPRAFDRAQTHLKKHLPEGCYSLSWFNDWTAESKNDVLKVFDKAIAGLR